MKKKAVESRQGERKGKKRERRLRERKQKLERLKDNGKLS